MMQKRFSLYLCLKISSFIAFPPLAEPDSPWWIAPRLPIPSGFGIPGTVVVTGYGEGETVWLGGRWGWWFYFPISPCSPCSLDSLEVTRQQPEFITPIALSSWLTWRVIPLGRVLGISGLRPPSCCPIAKKAGGHWVKPSVVSWS